jgi:hypothetical protein
MVNPYHCYLPEHEERSEFNDGKNPNGVYRKGDLLFVENHSALPGYCLWTNEEAEHFIDVEQIWQPKWLYWLLLLGVFPYFFIAPLYRRKTKVRVPMSQSKYSACVRYFWVAIAVMAVGASLLIGSLLLGSIIFSNPQSGLLSVIGFSIASTGFSMAARPFGLLRIADARTNCLVLRGVHPEYLNRLPRQR